MDDEVRRLLADFADRTVGEQPAADVDEDVRRGRRALRRVRLRRRTAGVIAAATAVGVLALAAGPLGWFTRDTTPVAAGPASPRVTAGLTPGLGTGSVVLAEGGGRWGAIGCGLSPAGWRAQQLKTGYAVLAPPGAVSLNDKVVLRTALSADHILKVQAVRQPGRIVHLGWYPAGERVAQTKLGGTWLIVRLPRGGQGWDDPVLLRFVGSCSVALPTPHS